MERKSVFVGTVLAVLAPGTGLIYAGRIGWAVVFFLVACLAALMVFSGVFAIVGLPLWFVTMVGSGIGTVMAVKSYNRRLV
jgi:hypothetical protein